MGIRSKTHATFSPRSGNWYGRKRKVVVTTRADGQLDLTLKNTAGTWSTEVLLDPDEVALLMTALSKHMEVVTTAQRVEATKAANGKGGADPVFGAFGLGTRI